MIKRKKTIIGRYSSKSKYLRFLRLKEEINVGKN